MLSRLRFDLLDRLREFEQLLGQLDVCLTQPPQTDGPLGSLVQTVTQFMESQLLSLGDDAFPPRYRQKWSGIRTELQRTSRLLATELVFWRSARTSERQQHYQVRLRSHCQQLSNFAQVLSTLAGGGHHDSN